MFRKNNILFFESDNEDNCQISSLWKCINTIPRLRAVFCKYKSSRVEKCYESHKHYTKAKKIRCNPSGVFVFANLDESLPVLKFKGECKYVQSSWFNHFPKNQKRIGIFFIANGANMLRLNKLYSKDFNNWISFQDWYDPLIGWEDLEKEARKIYHQLFSIKTRDKDLINVYETVKDIYKSAIERNKPKTSENVLINYKILHNYRNLTASLEEG